MWPIVLVSCYYRLTDHDGSYTHENDKKKWYRTHHEYMDCGRSFLSLTVPKILFVDPTMVNEMNLLLMECAEHDRSLIGMCRIVALPFSSLPLYDQMDNWSARLMSRDKYSPGYFVLVHSKPFFVRKAVELDLFPCRQIGFLDFGIAYIDPIPTRFVEWLYRALDEAYFRILFLEYYRIRREDAFVDVAKDLLRLGTGKHYVSAQLWFAPVEMMMAFVDRVSAIQEWMIDPTKNPDVSCFALEEYIFFIALYFGVQSEWDPLPCRPWLGTYTHVLSNVWTARLSLHQVCHHIRGCLAESDHAHFHSLSRYILQSIRENADGYRDVGVLDNLMDAMVWGLYYQDENISSDVFEILVWIGRYRLHTWSSFWSSIVSNFRYYWIRFRDDLPLPLPIEKK